MAGSKIEWTGSTWNPIVGCSVVSPGCTNCYAMRMAGRLERMGQERYAGLTKPTKAGPVWTSETRLVESALTLPLRTRRPTTWFVNSMSDLFHEGVTDEQIDRVFAVMALCPQHTFQVLTKRSARMREYLSADDVQRRIALLAFGMVQQGSARGWDWTVFRHGDEMPWPLPNVWLGVSAEDQRRADERVPDLRATPAVVRWVSAEPLLSGIDFTRIACPTGCSPPDYCNRCHPDGGEPTGTLDALAGGEIDWIVVGGESGRAARPMHPDWARQIRDACAAAGVAYFFKQWGAWGVDPAGERCVDLDGRHMPNLEPHGCNGDGTVRIARLGKARAGRLLDGVTHDQMPEVRHG